MPRLLGFTPTKSMMEAYNLIKKEQQLVHVEHSIDTRVVKDEAKEIVPVEIPTYTQPVKLSEMPSEIKDYSSIKRSVNLNPLSDE